MGDNSVPGIVGKIKRKQIAKIWKPPECPFLDEWIKKMYYILVKKYYSALKKRRKSCHMQQHR